MKPIALFSTLAVIAIIIAASFGLSVTPTAPIHNLPDSARDIALFVCPAADSVFDEIARGLMMFRNQLMMVFFFFFIFFLASLGWSVYQNLIKDKFEEKVYKFPFFLGKSLFWATIIVTVLMHSPNSFRTVGVMGAPGKFVLCQSNTPGSRPVRANAIIVHSKIALDR
ncbi:MAG: hypothetical protein LBK26_01240 [Rickettsiales bacterium]|nr:hypothetical protein [Rickettsiales bacterium]